jgi:hypothetical protein
MKSGDLIEVIVPSSVWRGKCIRLGVMSLKNVLIYISDIKNGSDYILVLSQFGICEIYKKFIRLV